MSRAIQRGMTLLEVLVALAVFAVVAAMAYSGLDAVITAAEGSEARNRQLRELQSSMLMLELDLQQAVVRPIRDEYGDEQPTMAAADYSTPRLAFTRGGRRNPTGLPRSGLQRVAYALDDDTLQRWSWSALDRSLESEPFRQPLLQGVEQLSLRFLDNEQQWHDSWPPLDEQGEPLVESLPRAVELDLELAGWGRIRRLFELSAWQGGAATAAPTPGDGTGGDN